MRQLGTLGERKKEIKCDQVRTQHEKRTEIERIAQQKQAMFQNVRSALVTDWGTLKGQYISLKREKTAAADRAAKRWDYARLGDERVLARSFLTSARLPAIEKRYNDIELTGDIHALRGFVEEAINILGNERKFTDDDLPRVGDMLNEFAQMRNDLTITPEMKELSKQGEILTERVRDVFEVTERAKREYYTVDEIGVIDNPFDQMTKSVQVRVRVDPETLAEVTEVNLDWE